MTSPSVRQLDPRRRGTSARRVPGRPGARGVFRSRQAWEPWRDWAVLVVLCQGVLALVAVLRPSLPWVVLASVALGLVWATGTLTVLHDAGHRRFGKRAWPNVLAVQTAVPVGLWVGHWGRKHRVHHRLTQVYPYDEPTRSSSMVRLHAEASWRPVHRYQHLYAWFLYGLAWAGELRSQVTYLRTGYLAGDTAPPFARRAASFGVEKLLCAAVLLPYAVVVGWGSFAVLLLGALTVASALTAVITAVGHINVGLAPDVGRPAPDQWTRHIVRTTASFSTSSRPVRWLTGAMTHHLAHHLRPTAARYELVNLHRDVLPALAARTGEPILEFPTLTAALRGHWRRLRELGQPEVDLTQPPAAGEPLPSLVAGAWGGS